MSKLFYLQTYIRLYLRKARAFKENNLNLCCFYFVHIDGAVKDWQV